MNNKEKQLRQIDQTINNNVRNMVGFSLVNNMQVKLWKAMLIGVFFAGMIGTFTFMLGFEKGQYIPQSETEAAVLRNRNQQNPVIPAGVVCDYTGIAKPVNQGLLEYRVYSDASNPATNNKVEMSSRFSMVDKNLASQYLILNDIGNNKMVDVVFSMLENYECMIPDWLYEKLEGLYLVKYQDEHVARASVMVFEDRETAIYVAQLLLALSTDELEFKTINGNYVAYTAQKAYWWTHDNMLVRIASHTTPLKADRNGIVQEPSYDFSVCETLDVLDEMTLADCVHDQFWREVPENMLYAYLEKLPSDGEEVTWPEQGQFSSLINDSKWPSQEAFQEKQLGCNPEKEEKMMEAFQMFDNFDTEKKQDKANSRLEDGVKITSAKTDKRWYYLGETVTISAAALSIDGNSGNVYVDVKDNIYPHPEKTTVQMNSSGCHNRVPYVEQTTGVKASKK